jgi:hypothetical protein
MSAVLKPGAASTNETSASGADAKTEETIDGFQLVIEALKLNGSTPSSGCPAFRSPT